MRREGQLSPKDSAHYPTVPVWEKRVFDSTNATYQDFWREYRYVQVSERVMIMLNNKMSETKVCRDQQGHIKRLF